MNRLLLLSSAFVGILIAGCTGESSQTPPGEVNQVQPDSAALANSPSDAPAEVRHVFTQYTQALANLDGEAAAKCVSNRTIDLYERCGSRALDSAGINFEEVPAIEVVLIFQLRYSLSREELESMRGSDIFGWSVQDGLVDQGIAKGLRLENIQVDGDVASATFTRDQQPVSDMDFRFVNESSGWKFDLMHTMVAIVDPAFDRVCQKNGMSKTELAVYLLEQNNNQTIPIEILTGPLK